MQGIVFALFSGLFIALQGIFNARLGDAVGPWLSVTIVHFVGLMGCLLIYGFVRDRKNRRFSKVAVDLCQRRIARRVSRRYGTDVDSTAWNDVGDVVATRRTDSMCFCH